MDGPIDLAGGETPRLDLDPARGTRERVPLPHPDVFAALAPGVRSLVDGGRMRLDVEEAGKGVATVRAVAGGPLAEREGVRAALPVSAMTRKDRADLAFAVRMGADWVAPSFVRRPTSSAMRCAAAPPSCRWLP